MNRSMSQPEIARGRCLWLIITVALGLALSSQAAAAKECQRETPLPADVHLIAPGMEVPESMARFAGVWIGEWERTDGFCQTLVVEEVFANGFARVIYSHGASLALNVSLPGFWRATGRIVDGTLRFHESIPERPEFAYRVAGETLEGTLQGKGHVRLTRVADVDQVGCGPQAGGLPPAPPAAGPRDRLTAAELLGPDAGTGLVHNAYFMPVGQAAPAIQGFHGTVTVNASTMFRARHGCAGLGETLPGFTVAFFTQGEHLVPVVRDFLSSPGIILSPGRVWSEPSDGGMSRASFPFVLTNRSRNGLATFLYDDTRVSAVRFQVVQENAPFRVKFDGWGQALLTYAPGSIADEEALRAQFAAELQQQTAIRPWSALPVAAETPGLVGFDGDTAPDDLKASGLIIDGVIYLRGCETRAGPYPYCRQMRHSVQSVTKSLGAAVTLLRLAQTYGDPVFNLKIKEYVTVTAPHDGWERVTFANALNMATGIGDNWPHREPNQPFADVFKSPKFFRFTGARTAQQRLDAAFSFDKYPWGPGEVLRYNDINTFILTAAMDSFLKRQVGPNAQLWDVVAAEVFRPIGIFHLPTMHTREAAGERGIPLLGHGLYPTIDDLAKLATLLQHGGQHQGQQLLSAAKLAEALYKTTAMGLPSREENRFGEGRYQLSFWSVPYRTANGCVFQIPYMAGLGGNLVVLLPNGVSAFRLADGHDYSVDTMVLAGEAIRPFPCPAEPGAPPPPARQPLTAGDLHAELAGHTLYRDPFNIFPGVLGGHLTIFLAADGDQYGTFKPGLDGSTEHDVGTWHITADGQFCGRWNVWGGRREDCSTAYREGETFAFYRNDRLDKGVFRRVSGNPEGY
ncbi:MAG: serine hydrolase [Candidatus Entotheonellia bacterium]